MLTAKQCTGCGVIKPLIDFHRHPHCQGGHQACCIDCARQKRGSLPREITTVTEGGVSRRRCSMCGEWKELTANFYLRSDRPDQHDSRCRTCEVQRNKKYQASDKYRGDKRAYNAQYKENHRDELRQAEARRRRQAREAALDHYGRSCACCGRTEALTIDHILPVDDDRKERLDGHRLYFWLIREGFPPGYQTLCSSCNASKGRGKGCRLHRAVEPSAPTPSNRRQLSAKQEYLRQWYEAHRDQQREYSREWRLARRAEINAKRARQYALRRTIVFPYYGDVCACCGGSDHLSIDHIDSETKARGFGYDWLIRQGLPAGFQTLCLQCNRSKGRGEHCRLHATGLRTP